jgi:hypothetical protein
MILAAFRWRRSEHYSEWCGKVCQTFGCTRAAPPPAFRLSAARVALALWLATKDKVSPPKPFENSMPVSAVSESDYPARGNGFGL